MHGRLEAMALGVDCVSKGVGVLIVMMLWKACRCACFLLYIPMPIPYCPDAYEVGFIESTIFAVYSAFIYNGIIKGIETQGRLQERTQKVQGTIF